jgi:hypothetical protein
MGYDMQRFGSYDLQRNVAKVQEAAMREPVSISYHGRDRLVMLPIEEFERLKRRDKQIIAMDELPDEFVQAMSQPYYDAEQAALDHLLDDDSAGARNTAPGDGRVRIGGRSELDP